MNYEAIDRDMSSWVISARKNGTLFFLTDEGLATDLLSRACRYRWEDRALDAAIDAQREEAWQGFSWTPMRVPQAAVEGK